MLWGRTISDAIALGQDGREPPFCIGHDQREMTYILKPAQMPKFDPRRPISALAARLLKSSNAMHGDCVDGILPSEAGASKHAGFRFAWPGKA